MRISNKNGSVVALIFLLQHMLILFPVESYATLGLLKLFIPKKHIQCPQSLFTGHKQFCQSFKKVARCHCSASGMPDRMCQNMGMLYKGMINVFGSVKQACDYQQDISAATCIDSWNCYRFGGKNAQQQWCNANGLSCT